MDENEITNEDEEFDIWNERKKSIYSRSLSIHFSFHERDIWWCSLGKNIGSEENGKHATFERPVIIFRKFGNDIVWAIPITTKEKSAQNRDYYKFILNNTIRNAHLSQMRPICTKRLIRYMNTLSFDDFQKIRKQLIELI